MVCFNILRLGTHACLYNSLKFTNNFIRKKLNFTMKTKQLVHLPGVDNTKTKKVYTGSEMVLGNRTMRHILNYCK